MYRRILNHATLPEEITEERYERLSKWHRSHYEWSGEGEQPEVKGNGHLSAEPHEPPPNEVAEQVQRQDDSYKFFVPFDCRYETTGALAE